MPTIDPKKIEGWKVLASFDGGEGLESRDVREIVRVALPALLAEREEMLAVLREVEWAGRAWEVDPEYACCPVCGGFRQECLPSGRDGSFIGHAPDCRLDAEIQRLAAIVG